jgi:hypothetical protein
MPIDPRQYALTPEGKQAERFADLERQVSRVDRSGILTLRRQYAEALGEVSTTLATPTDLGGPSITTTVLVSQFVAVYAECAIHTGGAGTAGVWLYEPTDLSGGASILASGSTTYVTMKTVPGSLGTTTIGGQFVHVPTAGERTFSLRYSITSGTGFFATRRLWVEVF